MPLGVVGKKVGMTRIFTDDGKSVPVTVLHVDKNRVTQLKERESDGYRAVQVAYGAKKPSRVSKVTGISKGKGFAGTIKRHNFRGQDNSHGNSISHRVPGSTGQCQTPGRVFKGKKMSGHMGDERVSTKNLTVVKVDPKRDLLLIKGAVPGAKGGRVIVKPAASA